MKATIHYTRDIDPDVDKELHEDISEFRFLAHGFGDDEFSVSAQEFNQYYTEEATIEIDAEDEMEALTSLWRGWNRGSGEESGEFLKQWCLDCEDEFPAGPRQNRTVQEHQTEYPSHTITGHRSMMVGDIVEVDDTMYLCASYGWDEIDLPEPGETTEN